MKKLVLKEFEYILFDVDDTLLDFQKSQDESIINAYKKFDIEIDNNILNKYKEINVMMWKNFEKNLITTNEIFNVRFDKLNELYNFNCSGKEIEQLFRINLNTSYHIIDGTIEFLNKVKDDYKLVIVTNGKYETQVSRLKLSGIDKYFKHIFISEEVGYKKPEIEFFKHIEKNIEGFDKTKAIIIGDSLTSDIQGGINYNIKTCFFNFDNKQIEHSADYMISKLEEIELN